MKKKPSNVPADIHAVFDAAVVTGAATGAVAGAMGGPPGVVVGGTIGATIGALTGAVLERELHAADVHDRALDDDIGVTRGDLGARKALHAGRSGTAATLLRAEHARLEVLYERLLEAYRFGDWSDVSAQWNVFEPALRAHMELEEREVFPAFREVDPAEAEYLLAEHESLRARLGVLGINVELHAVTQYDANDLVERLRLHRAREERLLYPWIDETFELPVTRTERCE